MVNSRNLFQLSALEDYMHHLILERTVFCVQFFLILSLIPNIQTGGERIKVCRVVQQIEEKEKSRLKKFY